MTTVPVRNVIKLVKTRLWCIGDFHCAGSGGPMICRFGQDVILDDYVARLPNKQNYIDTKAAA
jgi:hypothetical protein